MSGSIMEYNGGSVIAMAGANCVAIASDKRLGANMATISINFPKIFDISPNLSFGLVGLATDVVSFSKLIKLKAQMYLLQENRNIRPHPLSNLISSSLYSKR